MWASWSQSSLFSERMSSHSFSLSCEASPIPSLHATANTGQPLLFWFCTTRFSCRLFLLFIYLSPEHQCVALPLAINSLQTIYREWRNTAIHFSALRNTFCCYFKATAIPISYYCATKKHISACRPAIDGSTFGGSLDSI